MIFGEKSANAVADKSINDINNDVFKTDPLYELNVDALYSQLELLGGKLKKFHMFWNICLNRIKIRE